LYIRGGSEILYFSQTRLFLIIFTVVLGEMADNFLISFWERYTSGKLIYPLKLPSADLNIPSALSKTYNFKIFRILTMVSYILSRLFHFAI